MMPAHLLPLSGGVTATAVLPHAVDTMKSRPHTWAQLGRLPPTAAATGTGGTAGTEKADVSVREGAGIAASGAVTVMAGESATGRKRVGTATGSGVLGAVTVKGTATVAGASATVTAVGAKGTVKGMSSALVKRVNWRRESEGTSGVGISYGFPRDEAAYPDVPEPYSMTPAVVLSHTNTSPPPPLPCFTNASQCSRALPNYSWLHPSSYLVETKPLGGFSGLWVRKGLPKVPHPCSIGRDEDSVSISVMQLCTSKLVSCAALLTAWQV
mmetsp:Transcript_37240/g.66654  ORF Transcript_37240/g.66654 Transcript_37240/m.66654 type:complete len:269 (+) Transcript_37240:1026-1832(+)